MANIYSLTQEQVQERSFISRVYVWMSLGLLVTAVTAAFTASTPAMVQAIFGTRWTFIALIIAEFLLVMGLSAMVNRLSFAAAAGAFVVYSVLNGLTLSVIFLAYTASSIYLTFFVTAGTFGAMSVYGFVTRRDLTSVGNLCLMGLFGIIIGSVVNMFLANQMIYWITTYAGILIFVGLTAYDTQKIKQINESVDASSEQGKKLAIMGALALYLDFINLLLLLLRLFGRRR